jgi:hypothetical protein
MIASMANNTLWHPKSPDNNMAMAYLLVAKKLSPQLKQGSAVTVKLILRGRLFGMFKCGLTAFGKIHVNYH